MQEEDYDDMFAGMSDDIMKNIYIRFYVMEQYYEVGKPLPNKSKQTAMQQQTEPVQIKGVTMYFNRIVQQAINSLFLMNKLIYSKAKMVHSVLENGFEISAKKDPYWASFLEQQQFLKIAQAYNLIPKQKRLIIKYAVLSLSNILLKLSINMSKVSIIPVQKFITYQCLNIPVLSIIFLQFLEYKLLIAKNHNDIAQDTNFLKQLPKVSVVKLGYYKNNTEIQLLENSQHHLFTKKGKLNSPIKNLQFLQIHEIDRDPLYPNFVPKSNYEHIRSFSLQKIGKGSVRSPFKFQIFFIMETIIYPLIKQFRPDIILFIESYPVNMKVMDEEIRGLMITQMTEETQCHKIYVFKEIGNNKYDLLKDKNVIDPEVGEIISEKTSKVMETVEMNEGKVFKTMFNPLNLGQSQASIAMKKNKKILMDDFCFISLALIQKTNFDNALDASHRYFYTKDYLVGLSEQIQDLKVSMKTVNQTFIKMMDQKLFALKNMKDMLMLQNQPSQMQEEGGANKQGIYIINLMNKSTYFNSFYDLLNQEQQLLQIGTNKITYNQQDYLYVKYFVDRLLVFIIKSSNIDKTVDMYILSKDCKEKQLKLEKVVKLPAQQNDIQGCILIASDNHLYRGFGKYRKKNMDKQQESMFNTAIHRFQFEPNFGDDWQLIGTKSSVINPDGQKSKNIDLQKKIFGYGIYNPQFKNILFLGGYLYSMNQQKISTKIYLIKLADDKKILSIGKTNKILFKGVNLPINKLFLHPFVFGIPFQDKLSFILNSNGNYIHLNNSMKIFGTQLKISTIDVYNGIVSQQKLQIPNDDVDKASVVILVAQLINKLLVFSPYQRNNNGMECCVQTLDEGFIRIKRQAQSKLLLVYIPEELLQTKQPFELSFV